MIVAAGGRPIVEPDDIYDALGTVSAAGTLSLSLVRGAEELTVKVSFGSTPAGSESSGPVH